VMVDASVHPERQLAVLLRRYLKVLFWQTVKFVSFCQHFGPECPEGDGGVVEISDLKFVCACVCEAKERN